MLRGDGVFFRNKSAGIFAFVTTLLTSSVGDFVTVEPVQRFPGMAFVRGCELIT